MSRRQDSMTARLITTSITAVMLVFHAGAQQLTRGQYIEKYKDIAIEDMRTHGIPASITLAQGCLESGNGNSDLAVRANNHFGIKCHNDWKGQTYYKKDDEIGKSCFRKYKKAEDSFEDHSDFLRYRDRYAFLFDLDITDYKGWCYGLKKAGYATAGDYAENLIRIIEDYRLYEYDRAFAKKADRFKYLIPPSPSEIERLKVLEPARTSPLYKYSRNRTIYVRNKTAYIIAGDNDTYSGIAKEYNLFTKELLGFNDLREGDRIAPGTIVYIQKKRKRAGRYSKIHIASEGDTYYGISQRYAVRLKSLFKYNGYEEGDILHAGDEIYMRGQKK